MLGQLDNAFQRAFGLPYLFASRDFNIHSRCRYLLYKLQHLRGGGLRILDVGCGAGITLRHLATLEPGKIGRYVGIDLQAERLQSRYRNVASIDVDFHNVDLDDDWNVGTFDVVWCSEVIEHLINDAGQMEKMMRAVRPGGTVLITTPCLEFVEHMGTSFPPILKTSNIQDGGHVRHGYSMDDIEYMAADAGLLVQSIDGVNQLSLAETKKRYMKGHVLGDEQYPHELARTASAGFCGRRCLQDGARALCVDRRRFAAARRAVGDAPATRDDRGGAAKPTGSRPEPGFGQLGYRRIRLIA